MLITRFSSLRSAIPVVLRCWVLVALALQLVGVVALLGYVHLGLVGTTWLELLCLVSIGGAIASSTAIIYLVTRKPTKIVLQGSDARLRLAMEVSNAIAWERNLKTDEIRFTSTITLAHEHSMPYNAALAMVHPADREKLHQANQEAIAQRSSFQIEHRVGDPQSTEWRWFQASGRVLTNGVGDPICMIGMSVDITERKRLEEALHRSEAETRQILDSAIAAITRLRVFQDNTWVIDQVSAGCELLSGYTPEALVQDNMLWINCIEPSDWQAIAPQLFANIFAEQTTTYEYRLRHKDGSLRWVSQTNNSTWDEIQQCWVVTLISTNITERKQAEIALQKNEARFQELAAASPAVIYTVVEHPNNGIIHFEYLSPAAEAIHELPLEALRQDGSLITHQIHPDDRNGYAQAVAQCMELMQPFQHEWRIITPSGRMKWLKANSRPEKRETGEIVWHGIVMDVSDRKQAETALQQAKEAAETANHSKTAFLANMSHELRTPLNVILGFSQLMQRSPGLTLEDQEYLQLIYSNGNHLLKLINEILDLSKVEAGKITIDLQTVDLFATLRLIRSTLSERVSRKNLQFDLEISPNVPQFVEIDAQKLQQVLLNLLSNAIKFTERGGVTLCVAIAGERGSSPSTYPFVHSSTHPPSLTLLFQVKDTGVGIAPQDLELIFDAFAQTSVGQRALEGTGLGLSISRKLVQFMGGELTVESTVGQGSTFQFTLPVQAMAGMVVREGADDRPVIGLASPQNLYRILVVDDQTENRLLVRQLCHRVGLSVLEAATGKEALSLWQRWRPHLIWMDIRLPDLNGDEVTRRIRAAEQQFLADMPDAAPTIIIALTAQALMGDRALALGAGCDDYISKPFSEGLLFRKIAEYLDVEFIYADEPLQETVDEKPLSPEDLSVMPRDWVMTLYEVAPSCEEAAVMNLIQQIPPSYLSLRKGLERWTYDFEFNKLMDLAKAYLDKFPPV